MNIHLKRLGKKKIKKLELVLDKQPQSLRSLIEECVKVEVKNFNKSRGEKTILAFLTPTDIQQQSQKGKIAFGDVLNIKEIDQNKAIEIAILGYLDGLYVVFIDDEEICKIDQKIEITEISIVSFIRLTFLTGTYW